MLEIALSPRRNFTRQSNGELSSIDLGKCRRILIVKLDHIGDWVLCTPFLRNLRRNAPRAKIDAIVLPRVSELASACVELDRVVTLQNRNTGCFQISGHRMRDALEFRRDYQDGAFDLAVVPRWDADFEGAAQIAAGSRAELIVGFSERCTRRKRTINRGYDRFYTHLIDDRRPVHAVEHNLALLAAMKANISNSSIAVQVNDLDKQVAHTWLARHLDRRNHPLLALAPFAAEPKRTMYIRQLAELAHHLGGKLHRRVVVVGGPEDRYSGARLAAHLRPMAVSAAGQLTVSQSAALISFCDCLVGVDSGPAHLAAAVGTPVAILSCHPAHGSPNHANSPKRFAPWNPSDPSRVLVLQPNSPRSPCKQCCTATEPHCILNIESEARVRLFAFVDQALTISEAKLRSEARIAAVFNGKRDGETQDDAVGLANGRMANRYQLPERCSEVAS